MATIFIFNLIITIDKNLYVIYNVFYNKGVFIMSNENQKDNNKVSIMPFIILFLISIVIFAFLYFLHSKNIENRFNSTLQNYEKSMSAIFDSAIITNGSNENIYSAKEDLKLSFEVGFKMLESSMNEIMKNSNDILQFWFAFLSVIMIVFTIIGFFLNNNILENEKKQLEIVEKEARISSENIEKETKKLIEENNKNIQEYNLFNLGIQSANSKDYKLAIYYFNEVIKLNVNNVEAYYNKGLAKYYLANNEKGNKEEYNKLINEAIEDYNKAIELNPNLSEAYNNRGIVKYDLGNINEAIEDYNKAIELNPNYSIAYNNRGIAKSNLSNTKEKNSEEYNQLTKEAIEDCNKAIELNQYYAEAYNNRGLAKHDLADNKKENKEEYNKLINEAIEDYNKAIELNQHYAEAYNNRGVSKDDLGNINGAIEDYNKAIELNSNFTEAYNNRGNAKKKLQKLEEAIEDYNEAIRLNSNYSTAFYNRGLAKLQLVKIEEAIKDFIKAYESNNNNNEAKENSKNQLIILAKNGNETAIKFCEKHNINY